MTVFHIIDQPFFSEPDHQNLKNGCRIFELTDLDQDVPEFFNAVAVRLNGRLDSDLNWNDCFFSRLKPFQERGLKFFWLIDLGLFSQLSNPLSDSVQHLSLSLSLRYFRDHVWPRFHEHTIGVSLYQGLPDFQQQLIWDSAMELSFQNWLKNRFQTEEALIQEIPISCTSFDQVSAELFEKTSEGSNQLKLFCRDVALEYIHLLANELPGSILPYVLLDISTLTCPVQLADLLSKESYGYLHRMLSDGVLSSTQFTAEDLGYLSRLMIPKVEKCSSIGICVPTYLNKNLKQTLAILSEKQIPFRIISETFLTSEWQTLNDLIVDPDSISTQGLRKLKGFCAAGGRVIPLNKHLGLSEELLFSSWLLSKGIT